MINPITGHPLPAGGIEMAFLGWPDPQKLETYKPYITKLIDKLDAAVAEAIKQGKPLHYDLVALYLVTSNISGSIHGRVRAIPVRFLLEHFGLNPHVGLIPLEWTKGPDSGFVRHDDGEIASTLGDFTGWNFTGEIKSPRLIFDELHTLVGFYNTEPLDDFMIEDLEDVDPDIFDAAQWLEWFQDSGVRTSPMRIGRA